MSFGVGPLPFLFQFLLGLVSGVVYATILTILEKIKTPKALLHFFDFVFVSAVGVSYYLICFFTIEGEFRFFTVIALIFGLAVVYALYRPIKKLASKRKRVKNNRKN